MAPGGVTAPAAPTTAEQIRSACARAGGAMLAGEVAGLLDLIAAGDPKPAVLQVNGRRALLRLEIESGVAAGAEAWASARCYGHGPTRSARWNPAGRSTSTPRIVRWSIGWPPGCKGRCAAVGSGRWVWIGTACGCAWRKTDATTPCGLR